MADEKISAMPDASALTGAELVPIVQSGANKKTTLSNVVGGTTGQFQFNNSGAFGGAPLPFFGQTLPWVRPALNIGGPSSTFNTWLNRGGQATGLGLSGDGPPYSSGNPVTPGTGYVPGSISTLAGGTLNSGGIPTPAPTTLTVTDTQVDTVAINGVGSGGTPGPATLTTTTGVGTQAQFTVVIQADGTLTGAPSPVLTVPGDYTTNPTDITAEPVTSNDTAGVIVTTTLDSGGTTGYAINDTGTINTGNGDATYVVDSVSVPGAVLTYHLTADGTGYSTGSGVGTTVTSGAGDGTFTVNITATSGPLTGATVSLVTGALIGQITTSGSYATPPTNPVTETSNTGSGTGATWDLFWSSLATATDNTGGLPLVVNADFPYSATSITTPYITALLKPIGSPPWTIDEGAASVVSYSGGTAPLVLYNSTSDKALVITVSMSAAGWTAYHYNNVSNPALTTLSTIINGAVTDFYFAWWQIVNDGTNLTFGLSGEGIVYLPFYKEALASFITGVDYVGYGTDRESLSIVTAGIPIKGLALAILWNWVETSP